MSRISDIFTVYESTDTYEILNPLSEYIDSDADKNKITYENIEDTINSLFYMQAGENTPFVSAIRTFSSSVDDTKVYPTTTFFGIAQSTNTTSYYNDELSWAFSGSGYGTRYLDDDVDDYKNYVSWKASYPQSNILGGRPISSINYKSIKIIPTVYYMVNTEAPNPEYNYTTPYHFLQNYKLNNWVITGIGITTYSPVPSTSIMYSQKIETNDPVLGGTIRTFCTPYMGNTFPRIDFYKNYEHRYFIDYTNTEYFDNPIQYGTGRFDIVYPLKPDKLLNFIAAFGYIFEGKFTKDETQRFYPVVNGGIISGDYVEKIEDWKSDNSKWENTYDLDRPKPDKNLSDDTEEMTIGYSYGVGGFAKYLYFSSADILKLFINHLSHEVKAPLSSIIGCSSYPVYLKNPVSNIITTSEETVYGYNVQVVKSQTGRISMGSINVPNLHNNFLDTSPYTEYELYIPLCGWVTLPDKVHGKQIKVWLTYDIISTSCKAIVQCMINGTLVTVAEKSGKIGTSELVSATDNVSKQTAITSALLNTSSAVFGMGVSVATGNVLGAIASTSGLANSVTQDTALSHTSYVSSIGATGDRSDFANSHECYLKITTVEEKTPSNYNHVYGRPCNQSGKISEFSGYTICTNVDTTGINAPVTVKNKIKSILESGVYL